MKRIGIDRADLVGYSLGGGRRVAHRHPAPPCGAQTRAHPTTFKRDGLYPEVLAAMDQMGPQVAGGMRHSPLSQLYPNADWPGLFTKLADRLRQKYDWPNDVAGMKAPTMIVFADADAIGCPHHRILRVARRRPEGLRLFPIKRDPVTRQVDVFSEHVCAFGRSHSRPAHEFNEIRRIGCIGVELLLSDVLDDCKKLLPSWRGSNRIVHFHLFEVGRRRVANHFVVECDCEQWC